MAIRSGFFNAIEGDRTYDASRFAEYFNALIGNGIFPEPTNNLQVVSNNDMTITVKAGKSWINGYIVINDSDYILNIDAADGVLNRVDRVVARYDVIDREIRLQVKKGEFASEAIAPVIQRDSDAYELGLALINVSASTGSILTANITDTRLDDDVCGIVSSLLKNDFTVEEKEKLAEIEEGATNYQHPSTHSLDIITETTLRKIFSSTERTKLAGIASGAQVNTVTSVAGKTGAVSVTKSDVGLSDVLNYGIATQAEAEAGTSNVKYMTPLRVKQAQVPMQVVYSGNVPAGATITAVTFNKFEYTGFFMEATASTYGIVGEINQAGNSIMASRGTGSVAEFNLTTSDLFIAGFNSSSGARIDANISGENITLKIVNRDTSNPKPYRIVLYRTN